MKKIFLLITLMFLTLSYAQQPSRASNGLTIGDPIGTGSDPATLEKSFGATIYWNATLGEFRKWNGSVWSALVPPATFGSLQQVTDVGYVSTNPIELTSYFQGGLDETVASFYERYVYLKNLNSDVIFTIHYNYWNGASFQTSKSMFLGKNAGRLAKGIDIIGIGEDAAESAVTNTLIAIGTDAGKSTTGTGVFIGQSAGSSHTGAGVGIGLQAGRFNKGVGVSLIGDNAGYQNDGGYVIGIGDTNTQENFGDNVAAIGRQTARFNSGDFVNAIGYQGMYYNTADNSYSIGESALKFGTGNNLTAIGANAFEGFVDDVGNAINMASAAADVDTVNDRITLTAHGFTIGERVNLRYSTTGTEIGGFTAGEIYCFEVNTVNILESVDVNIFSVGTDTHTFTPAIVLTNSTAIGANSEPIVSNQIMLGDANITSVRTANTSYVAVDDQDFVTKGGISQPYGGAGMEANATATTINTIGIFEDIAGTFVANVSLNEVTVGAGGLLTYTGSITRHFHIVSNLSVTVAANNQTVEFQWFYNGGALQIPIETRIGTGADVNTMAVHADVMMETGDTLLLRVTNETTTASVTVQDVYIFIVGML